MVIGATNLSSCKHVCALYSQTFDVCTRQNSYLQLIRPAHAVFDKSSSLSNTAIIKHDADQPTTVLQLSGTAQLDAHCIRFYGQILTHNALCNPVQSPSPHEPKLRHAPQAYMIPQNHNSECVPSTAPERQSQKDPMHFCSNDLPELLPC